MKIENRLGSLAALATIGWMAGTMTACAQGEKMADQIHESGYTTPFPLQQGGEKIDVLVRVKDKERGYYFNLVFVEKRDWPQEKKDYLRRIYEGRLIPDPGITPYPVKLRFRLDSSNENNDIHIDKIVTERDGVYVTRYVENGNEIWRSHQIHSSVLEPGVYRIRVDNLAPAPEIDFETLFQFERDNRKY